MLPDIFKHRKAQADYNNWLALRFHEQAGGKDLVEVHKSEVKERDTKRKAPLCWWANHINRDTAAKEIISTGRMKFSRSNGDGYTATCTASHVPGAKHQFLEYDLHCNRNGDAACSCPDFQIHGGACKHLCALRLTIEHWISQQLEMPFHFPISREEAEKLRLEWMIESNNDAATGSHGGLGGIPEFPVPQVVQWDPTIIQNIGGDRTILGDDDDDGLVGKVDDLIDSDSDSDLDMNDSESDTEFGIGMVCLNFSAF